MKNVLHFTPTIYFSMEPGETQEEAEERLLNILETEGIYVETYSAFAKGEPDEVI